MVDLFIRTASQALQAFLPIAFGLAAFRRRGLVGATTAIRWGIAVAAIATVPAGWLLQRTARQSLSEAILAVVSLGCVAWLARASSRAQHVAPARLLAITALLVTRQTMEIDAVFVVAAFQLRSLDAILAIGSAVLLAIALAAVWTVSAVRFGDAACRGATRAFGILFVSQLAMYAFHESAEAGVLPWSDVLHLATEPYGPDGLYGRHVAWFLIAVPLATAIIITARRRWPARSISARPASSTRYAIAASAVVIVLGGGALSLRSATPRTPVLADEISAMASAPYVLFRHTLADQEYGKLSIASLAEPSRRQSVGFPCERVAFAAGRGICLQAARGVFTTYRATLFDSRFATLASWPLAGSPSRARVAQDGRVGATTVFVTGHGYGSAFSTKTTLIDMASGETLGDLEQFATWHNGTRMRAADFNFWGVTFGRDSNHFYATLGTAGKTYLVRGDLGLRKLTVLYEGVECPSLSPDERLIVFKKRTGTVAGRWRLAVLELATMTERPMASETRNIDDQVEWLDSEQVLYGVPRAESAVVDTWVARVDATTPARVLLPAADSAEIVRPPSSRPVR